MSIKQQLLNLAKGAYLRFYETPFVARTVVSQFTRLYYQTPVPNRTWHTTLWLGTRVLKCPFDLWNYQEILAAEKPDLIIESGTASGGSALFLASIMQLLGKGRVISIDIEGRPDLPRHERVTYLTGSSVSREILEKVRGEAEPLDKVFVILDSDHSKDHVLQELRLYGPLVTPGGYLIVEDTCINGHPVAPQFGPGPMEAVVEFLKGDPEFVCDERDRKFLMTFNPRGYLRRVKAG